MTVAKLPFSSLSLNYSRLKHPGKKNCAGLSVFVAIRGGRKSISDPLKAR